MVGRRMLPHCGLLSSRGVWLSLLPARPLLSCTPLLQVDQVRSLLPRTTRVPRGPSCRAKAHFLCARHGVDAGGASPLRALVMGTASRRQLRRREAGWGGSRRPSPELTNRNRIEGRCGGVTRQWTGTPGDHPDTRTGKSGSARAKQQRLTLGGLSAFPGDPEQDIGNGIRRVGRSQPRP
jgi:hypothetical protein